MPKNKPNKGLLKRVKVTKSGKIKMSRAYGRHLRSGKSGSTLRGYRRPKYAHASDVKRVAAMLFMSVKPHVTGKDDASEDGAGTTKPQAA